MSSSCYTWRFGYGKLKVKYAIKEDASRAVESLQADYSRDYHIYKCPACGFWHAGEVPRPKPQDLYSILGNMIAAHLRGKSTPPLEKMRRK